MEDVCIDVSLSLWAYKVMFGHKLFSLTDTSSLSNRPTITDKTSSEQWKCKDALMVEIVKGQSDHF